MGKATVKTAIRLYFQPTKQENLNKEQQEAERLLKGFSYGFRSVNDGPELIGEVVLEINYEEIAKRLGYKAFRNKAKEAREIGGLLVAKIVNIQPSKPEAK